MAKHVSVNNVNNIIGENYDEREIGTDKNSWIQVVNGQKTPRRQNYPQESKQIATSNHFVSLQYLQEPAVGHHSNDLVTSKILEGKERKVLMKSQPKHRTLIIGDCHVRGHAERLSDNLGHSFNITGYVRPNSNFNIITNTAISQNKIMTKNNVIVLWGSAKNTGETETYKRLCCISQ